MEYSSINPATNIRLFTSTKPKGSYPEGILQDIKLISFEKDKDATPFGSFIYRLQKYPGDVDLVEVFSNCCDADEVAERFAKRLKKMVKQINSKKNHFYSEFKAGSDFRYDINIGKLENGIYHPNPELVEINRNLYQRKLLPAKEFDAIQGILLNSTRKTLRGNDYDIIYNILREHKVLRWSAAEILQGYKVLPGKITKELERALIEPGHVKIDMISLINGKFVEVTNFLMLAVDISGTLHPINTDIEENHNIPVVLPVEIEKLYFSDFYYSPFKMIKRIYSLSRNVQDTVTLEKIIPFVSSNVSLLYQIRSEVDTIELIISKYKNPSPTSIYNQLDNMKLRLSTVLELSDDDLEELNNLIDAAKMNKDKTKKIALLKEIKDKLKIVINYETINYLEKVGLNPPPSYLLPEKETYDWSLVRTPYENPKNPVKQILGGSVSSWLFQKGANIYRRNFCNGKARPLLDGEYHYGCHNFTGPGTRIDLPQVANYPPYNDIDACSRDHDIAYEKFKGNPEKIRQADEDAVRCYNKYPNENGYTAATLGINGKMALENVLPFVIKSIAPDFSGVGYEAGCEECGGDDGMAEVRMSQYIKNKLQEQLNENIELINN